LIVDRHAKQAEFDTFEGQYRFDVAQHNEQKELLNHNAMLFRYARGVGTVFTF
jgi:hypothetical protein